SFYAIKPFGVVKKGASVALHPDQPLTDFQALRLVCLVRHHLLAPLLFLLAILIVEDTLPDSQALRRDFQQFIFRQKLDAVIQTHHAWWRQANAFFREAAAHV